MKNKLLYDNYLLHQVHELVMQVAFFSLLILRNLHQTYRKKKIINYFSLLLEKCCGLVVAKLATEPAAKMLRSSFQKTHHLLLRSAYTHFKSNSPKQI